MLRPVPVLKGKRFLHLHLDQNKKCEKCVIAPWFGGGLMLGPFLPVYMTKVAVFAFEI